MFITTFSTLIHSLSKQEIFSHSPILQFHNEDGDIHFLTLHNKPFNVLPTERTNNFTSGRTSSTTVNTERTNMEDSKSKRTNSKTVDTEGTNMKPDNSSRTQVNMVAEALVSRPGDPPNPERGELDAMSLRIRRCGLRNPDAWGDKAEGAIGLPLWYPRCRERLCPWCQLEVAEKGKREFTAQFSEYERSGRLCEIRLSPVGGNVPGEDLPQAMGRLKSAFCSLTRSEAWKKQFERCGGVIHLPWKFATEDHEAGYWPHMHVLALARTKKPRFKKVLRSLRKILGLEKGTPQDDYLHHKKVKKLGRLAFYVTKLSQLIPAYPTSKDPRCRLREIPDSDLLAFTKAMKNQRLIHQRGFDPDISRASRKRGR